MSYKFIGLLSGGLDSPVAFYIMLKKGYEGIALSFFLEEAEPKLSKEKIISIVKKLSEITGKKIKLYLVEHGATLTEFIHNGIRKLTCIMCKRYMLRAARLLARKEGASFICTGEILGEQASQTLDNMIVIQSAVKDIPVIRPLVGFEKMEVIALSRKAGLYDLSSIQVGGCNYNPRYPETHARFSDIELSEAEISYDKMAVERLASAELIEIG